MTTMPKGINWNEQFYKLLRLSLGLTQEFPVDVDADGWRRLLVTSKKNRCHKMAVFHRLLFLLFTLSHSSFISLI